MGTGRRSETGAISGARFEHKLIAVGGTSCASIERRTEICHCEIGCAVRDGQTQLAGTRGLQRKRAGADLGGHRDRCRPPEAESDGGGGLLPPPPPPVEP